MESAREGRRKTEKIGIGIEIGTKLRELRITKRKKKMEDLTQSTSSEILRRKNETKRTTRIRHYGLGSGWKWASLLELMLPDTPLISKMPKMFLDEFFLYLNTFFLHSNKK